MSAPLRRGPRRTELLSCAIVRGEPWTARLVRNNHLRQYGHELARVFAQPAPIALGLRDACLRLCARIEGHSPLFTDTHPNDTALIPMILRLAAYASHWIRPPETWVPQGHDWAAQVISLIEHLFVIYPLPSCYLTAWRIHGPLHCPERDWFCHVARGGSLRTAPGMTIQLSRRAAHLLQQNDRPIGLREAIRRAQLEAIGAKEALIAEVLHSGIATDFRADHVWLPLFMKMARSSTFATEHAGLIIDYLHHEIRRHSTGLIDIQSRSLEALQRSAWRFYSEMRAVAHQTRTDRQDPCSDLLRADVRRRILACATAVWPRMKGVSDFAWQSWQIVELNSGQALFEEGCAMHHCVANYIDRCRFRGSAIFSLRRWNESEWESHATIEVFRNSRRVGQVRSIWNSEVPPRGQGVIRRWVRESGLFWWGYWD